MNRQKRRLKARAYYLAKTWQKFFFYKVCELGLIPIAIFLLWKLPLWTGWGFIKLFGIDAATNIWFCDGAAWTGWGQCTTGADNLMIWFAGFIILLLLSVFILVNYLRAEDKASDEAATKYDITYGELYG
jgi:hypothetical protein